MLSLACFVVGGAMLVRVFVRLLAAAEENPVTATSDEEYARALRRARMQMSLALVVLFVGLIMLPL